MVKILFASLTDNPIVVSEIMRGIMQMGLDIVQITKMQLHVLVLGQPLI